MPAIPTRYYRLLSQWFFFGLWVLLIYLTKHPIDHWVTRFIPVSFFLRIDPLVMTVVSGGMRVFVTITLLGLVTFGITVLLGRVFCGWVCPLGSIFDAYGWVLQRLRVPFEGPSPWWFRFKYYLLIVMLLFSVFGAVSPLMGFDPIVIITRVMATLVEPWMKEPMGWGVEQNVLFHSYFFDVGTLILFVFIMAGTTRLSRIWCRTACPLGAYLAVSSKVSVLRRETEGCIHCNICATHCPTGAIDFSNEEIYNESECIKCFSCSQICPVDANYFKLKSPFPTRSKSHYLVSLKRRSVVCSGLVVAFTAPILRLSAGMVSKTKVLLRPPMSRKERDFLSSCIRCNECTKACPTGILKAADLSFGLRALWTPVMVPTEGFCEPECNACSEACPTDAILKYPIDMKYRYKAGTAVLSPDRCISYTERKFCSECIRVCPTNAFEVVDGWIPDGEGLTGADVPAPEGQTPKRPVRVNYDRCVGCGACEYECNKIVFGEPAMVTTSYGRAIPTHL